MAGIISGVLYQCFMLVKIKSKIGLPRVGFFTICLRAVFTHVQYCQSNTDRESISRPDTIRQTVMEHKYASRSVCIRKCSNVVNLIQIVNRFYDPTNSYYGLRIVKLFHSPCLFRIQEAQQVNYANRLHGSYHQYGS